jgi:hypothetical protein
MVLVKAGRTGAAVFVAAGAVVVGARPRLAHVGTLALNFPTSLRPVGEIVRGDETVGTKHA